MTVYKLFIKLYFIFSVRVSLESVDESVWTLNEKDLHLQKEPTAVCYNNCISRLKLLSFKQTIHGADYS